MLSDIETVTEAICGDIDAARGELVDLCAQLVAAPSVNPLGRTTEVAAVVRDYLSGHGLATETIKADDEAPNVVGQVGRGFVRTPRGLQRAYGYDGSGRRIRLVGSGL